MTDENNWAESEPQKKTAEESGIITSVGKGSGIALAGRMIGRLLTLAGQSVLARSLGTSDYGLFSLGWSILQISISISPMGLTQGVTRFAAPLWKRDEQGFRRVIQQSLFLATITTLFWSGLFYWLSSPLVAFYQKPALLPVLQAVAVAMAGFSIMRVAAAAARISRRMQFSTFIEDVFPAAVLLVTALLFTVLWQGGLEGSAFSLIVTYLMSLVSALFTLNRLYPGVFRPTNWVKKLFRDLSAFSFPATVAGILMLLLQWITRLILGYLRPEAEVGIYQAAYQIATLPAIILIALSTVFMSIIAQLAHDGQFEKLNELYKITTKWSLYLSLPVALSMCFFPKEWLTLLFGPTYSEGDKVLVLIVLSQLINAGTGAVASMYLMLNQQKSLIWIQVASLLLVVSLNFWLIPIWGAIGAAIGSALGIAIANLAQVFYLRIRLNLWPYDQRYWKGIISTFFSALAIWLFSFLPLAEIYLLIFSTFLSIAVFIFTLWKMQLDPEDKIFVDGIRRRLGM